ncbi:MAG: hypothetical protein NC131_11330 [Roseburia sp.]|nr:hypothetical protein [Roseburia sp.]
MAMTGYRESTLINSEIYQGLKSGGSDPAAKAVNLIRTAKHLTMEDIEAGYISVKQITDTLTREAVKAFDVGRTVLIYNSTQSLSLSQSLPFITFKGGNGYTTYVFMDKYITMTKDGVLSVRNPDLRDLLTGALIANAIKRNYDRMASNQYLMKTLNEIYVKLFMRIINREFSLAANKIVFDVLQYWVSRFFLVRVFGANDTPENIENVACSHFKYVDELKYDEIKRQYDEADPVKVSDLLELLKTASPRMKSLNLGIFLSNWINYYYIPSTMAIDNIEYLIFMILTLLSGNNIINISAADIVKEAKNVKSLRGELLKLI